MDDDAVTACAIRVQLALNELIQVHGFTPLDALSTCVQWFNDGRDDPESASETLTVGRVTYS